jgi:hypothetical protein
MKDLSTAHSSRVKKLMHLEILYIFKQKRINTQTQCLNSQVIKSVLLHAISSIKHSSMAIPITSFLHNHQA